MPNRLEWQQLAEDRILDAAALLAPNVGRWSAAYYLVGYAVECGLKSCILAHLAIHPHLIFESRMFSNEAWTHDIEALVRLADLKAVRDADAAANASLNLNWQRVKDWKEKARYEQISQVRAEQLYEAVTDAAEGVMPWIRIRW